MKLNNDEIRILDTTKLVSLLLELTVLFWQV